MAHFTKHSYTIDMTSGVCSSGTDSTAIANTRDGYLEMFEYVPDGSNPWTGASSGVIKLYHESDTGTLITRSTSGLAATHKRYAPRIAATWASSGGVVLNTSGAVNYPTRLPLSGDIRMVVVGSSLKSTESGKINLYVG